MRPEKVYRKLFCEACVWDPLSLDSISCFPKIAVRNVISQTYFELLARGSILRAQREYAGSVSASPVFGIPLLLTACSAVPR
jgi:hypothetical protein